MLINKEKGNLRAFTAAMRTVANKTASESDACYISRGAKRNFVAKFVLFCCIVTVVAFVPLP